MGKQLELQRITKSYGKSVKTPVLKDISLGFEQGEFAAIIGQSGSGKSTLLNIIGLLDVPDSGTVVYNGKILNRMNDDARAHFRNQTMGFIFQFHHLLPEFTALENVLIPWHVSHGTISPDARNYAIDLLKRVGVEQWMNNRSTNLSGGQQQRVAIARSLMNKPELLLADEPTGNLDSDSAESVFALMREINRELKTTFIIVTHDRHIAASCNRVIEIADGIIRDDLVIDTDSKSETWDKLSPCYCRMRRSG